MWYALLADLLVALHFGYFSFVVVGQLLILVGIGLKWAWVRNVWIRTAHLAAMGLVGIEAVGGIICPLTTWERQLRALAGQHPSEISFVGRLLNRILFLPVPEWQIRIVHVVFTLLVVATFIWAPPRLRRRRQAG
jgi:hypothetical protein